jgi:glutamate synthase (NADPH/NADH) large chain
VGRTDLLMQFSRGGSHLDDLDLNPLLVRVESVSQREPYTVDVRQTSTEVTLDHQILADAAPLIERGEKMQLSYTVTNVMRTIGTRTSSAIVRRYGSSLLPDHLKLELRGSAGQSLGAFAVQGLCIELTGEANDYVAKGLSGATVIVRPPRFSADSENDVLVGNTTLYGATSGKLYVAGRAGERFAVRNSGAHAVVEGCGAHGCEYMTGGVAVILGEVGANFAAGMTGGQAFVYDASGSFASRLNPDNVVIEEMGPHEDMVLKALLHAHLDATGSPKAKAVLESWAASRDLFRVITPKDLLVRRQSSLKMGA